MKVTSNFICAIQNIQVIKLRLCNTSKSNLREHRGKGVGPLGVLNYYEN